MSRSAYLAYGTQALLFTVVLALIAWAEVAWLGVEFGAPSAVVGSGVAYFLGMRRAHVINRAEAE